MEKQYDTDKLIRSFIDTEKEKRPNPFLHTRVMEAIKADQQPQRSWYQPVMKPLLALSSLALVIWLGIVAGSTWSAAAEGEVYLENDSRTENLSLYVQAENEQP